MDIIEEIKRSAAEVAERAKEKTANLANYAKLNFNLKTAEGKLEETYEIIGRLFYTSQREGEDNASAIADYFIEADNLKAEMESLRKEIAKARNVKFCPACGEEIDINFEFCNHCGAKQEEPVEEEPAEEPKEEDKTEE